MSASAKFDIHQEITNHIVSAIETAGEFTLPWIRSGGGCHARPVNILTKKPYNGVNIVSLWVSALSRDFGSNLWGTYRQWQERGCQVRKGEKSSLVVFYKTVTADDPDADAGDDHKHHRSERLIARASHVFNASQVDGFGIEDAAVPDAPVFDPIEVAEQFVSATGARVREQGDQAFYSPATDIVTMPERRRFVGSPTSTPVQSWYSTLCHELVHWSGVKSRLDRDLSGRFASEAYAMEELVAELGAAFLCSDLGIAQEPRVDHACYLANWLAVLKSDKKAIFTAASKASEAALYLMGFSGSLK